MHGHRQAVEAEGVVCEGVLTVNLCIAFVYNYRLQSLEYSYTLNISLKCDLFSK